MLEESIKYSGHEVCCYRAVEACYERFLGRCIWQRLAEECTEEAHVQGHGSGMYQNY